MEERNVRSNKPRSLAKRVHSRIARHRRLYVEGNRALTYGDLDTAESKIRSAIAIAEVPPAWIQRLGFVQERQKKYRDALRSYYRAISLDGEQAEWFYRAGVCAKSIGNLTEALELFEKAATKDATHARAAEAIATSIPPKTPGWRRLDLLNLSLDISPTAETLRAAAKLAYSMHKYSLCADYLQRLVQGSAPSRADVINLACAMIRTGENEAAYKMLSDIAATDSNSQVKQYGPGAYVDKRKEWDIAFTLHAAEWNQHRSTESSAAFAAAYALDRQYLWHDSLEWYRRANDGRPEPIPYWAYKYAHALERSERYDEAIKWYSRALILGNKTQWDWHYRLGYCALQTGALDTSYHALRTWARKSLDPEAMDAGHESDAHGRVAHQSDSGDVREGHDQETYLYTLESASEKLIIECETDLAGAPNVPRREIARARKCRMAGDSHTAARHYAKFLRSTVTPDIPELLEISKFEYECGNKRASISMLLNSREFFRPDGMDVKQLTKSQYTRRRMRYAEYMERLPVDSKAILFESFWGTRISDNPLALYNYLNADERFAEYTFYWTYQESTEVPRSLSDDGRTVLVKYGSEAYDRVLATSGTLVNNTSFVEYFQRRAGQKYVNTWHGTPLKTLGRRINTGILEHANVARNFMQTTLLALPNEHTAETLIRDYDVSAVSASEWRVTGSPRLDALNASTSEELLATRKKLGISEEDGRRIVFYAPTWRGSADNRSADAEICREALSAIAKDSGNIVVFRAHHLVESGVAIADARVIVAPSTLDTYEIMSVADVLVTDYSSLLFDFLVTGRQVISYQPDLVKYRDERGLYLEPSDVINEVANSPGELESLLERESFTPDNLYKRSQLKFCDYEDGLSSQRIADYIYAGGASHGRVRSKGAAKRVVFFESLIPNGIRSSFLNLCNTVDPDEYDFTVALDVQAVRDNEDRADGLQMLPEHVSVIGRIGAMHTTMEERYALNQYASRLGDVSPALTSLVHSAYEREFRRVFGVPQPETLFVDFEGYSRFWNALIAYGTPDTNGNGVILHNQMDREMEVRFPHLAEIIRNYGAYDSIASVARSISDGNKKAARALSVPLRSEPLVVHNIIDVRSIKERAARPESEWSRDSTAFPKLVSAARVSPEKNHVLMVDAFWEVKRQYPQAELVILGDGPSMSTVRNRIDRLGLSESVHTPGFVNNPMPTIAESDLFFLTSAHEGQPMVLFEAMALGLPIVTTPVPGCVEAIEEGEGAVADPNPKALAKAVAEVLSEKTSFTFSGAEYNSRALAELSGFIQTMQQSSAGRVGRDGAKR